MRPRRRYLKRNKGTEAPSSLLFFDAESHLVSDPARPNVKALELRLWCAIALRLEGGEITREEVTQGHTAAEFWAAVESRQDASRPLWAFAHNLGFDLTQLDFWSRLESGEYTRAPTEIATRADGQPKKRQWKGKMVLSGRPTFLFLQGRVGKVKLIDTGNYWPKALWSIGRAHGLEKGTFPGFKASDDTMFAYCMRDCEIIRLAVCQLIDRWTREKCGVFQATAPSLSMHNFQHTATHLTADGEKVRILIDEASPARPVERAAYYGPRVEPFFLGVHPGPVHLLDCNSLFPAMMARHSFPFKCLRSIASVTPDELRRLMHAHGAAATVSIDSTTDTYPIRHDGIQIHARGQFSTALCGPELRRALDRGHVSRVHECWLYRTASYFRDWVLKWYERKVAALRRGPDGAGDLEFAKLMLNSLYGKFAQRGDHWQDDHTVKGRPGYTQWAGPHPITRTQCYFRSVAGLAQVKIPGGESADAFPAISAYVTAHAREYMRGVFSLLPRQSLLYSAMDSLLVTDAGRDAVRAAGLVDPEKLGFFREVSTHAEIEVKGPGWYRLDNRWIRSGLYGGTPQKRGKKLFYQLFQSLPSVLGKRPDGRILVYESQAKDSQTTLKGTLDADGFTHPFYFTPEMIHSDPLPRRRGARSEA